MWRLYNPLILTPGGYASFLSIRVPAFAPLTSPLGSEGVPSRDTFRLPSISGPLGGDHSSPTIWRKSVERLGKEIPEPPLEEEEQLFRDRGTSRNCIWNKYAFLVGLVLKISKYRREEGDEARQCAELALLESVDAFPADSSVRFSDFAFERMRSAIQGQEGGRNHEIPRKDAGVFLATGDPDAPEQMIAAESARGRRATYDEAIREVRDSADTIPLNLQEAVRDFLGRRGDWESLSDIAVQQGVPLQLVIDAVWRLASSHESLREIGSVGCPKRAGRKRGVPRDQSKAGASFKGHQPLPPKLEESGKTSYGEYQESLLQRVALLEEGQRGLHEVTSEVRERLLRDWGEWRREFASEEDLVSAEVETMIRDFLPTYALFAVAHYGREIPASVTFIEWVYVNAHQYFKTHNASSPDPKTDEEWRECRHVLIRFLSTQSVRRGRGYREEATPEPLLSADKVRTSLGEPLYSRFRDYLLHELGRYRLPPYEKSYLFRRLLDLFWVYGDELLRGEMIRRDDHLPFHQESYRKAVVR